ncbi:MAG: hypothetical protein J5I47_12000 [Vicingus serpentipes]|nr:hypothetical protein [Vicingus serpentipes]
MKNLLLLSLTIILSFNFTFSQKVEKKLEDLNFLLIDEKYEDVVYKGENYMQNEDLKRHPLVYLYTAKGYYEMSKQPGKFDVGEKDSKYPKPLKTAEKHLYKYIKQQDKAKKYFPDYEGTIEENMDFFEAIADTANKLGQLLYAMEQPRKSASEYKNAFRAVPMDPILQLWQGIGEVESKNSVEGDKNILAALESIDENFKPFEATKGVIAHGMQIVEEYLRSKGDNTNADKAKKLIEVYKQYDPDELDKQKKEERKKKMKADDKILRKFYSDEDDEDNINKKKKITIDKGVEDIDKELDELEKEVEDNK